MEFLRNLSARHEQLKKKIHSTRIPLSKRGQTAMGVVYFTVPIVCGYFIMKWTERKADENFHKQVTTVGHALKAFHASEWQISQRQTSHH